MADAIRAACPKGIDVYFENVGGKVLEAVAPLLNPRARVPICGFVSQYNAEEPVTPFTVLGALPTPPFHRFFLVWEWPEEYPAAVLALTAWGRRARFATARTFRTASRRRREHSSASCAARTSARRSFVSRTDESVPRSAPH